MAKFKPGEKAVCVDDKGIRGDGPHPKEGEIVTIERYSNFHNGNVILSEYSGNVRLGDQVYTIGSFSENRFEPLMDISELTEILETQPAEV